MKERVEGLTHSQWDRKWKKERQKRHQGQMLKVWILLNLTLFMVGVIVGINIS